MKEERQPRFQLSYEKFKTNFLRCQELKWFLFRQQFQWAKFRKGFNNIKKMPKLR